MNRLRIGPAQLYIEPRDIWVGVYVAPDAVYICPLPLVVVKVDRSLRDRSSFRLIPPPKVGRWQIVALSLYSNRADRVVGRYRSRLVARLIASRLPNLGDGRDEYIIERVEQGGESS